jgi:hypothetical protein
VGGVSGATGSSSSAAGGAGSYAGGGGAGAYSKSTTLRNGGAGAGGEVSITVPASFAFTPGNLAVLVPGDAAANNTTLNILEVLTNVPNQVSAFFIPIDASDLQALHMSGSAGTSGCLGNSGDGTLLAFTGVNTNTYTTTVNSIVNRGVGTLNPSGNYVLQTTYVAPIPPAAQPRGAATIDDTNWLIGDQGGVYTNGSTAPSPVGNYHAVKSFGGTNYVLEASASVPAVMIVSAAGTNYMPGIPADANATDFYFVQSGQNGALYDVLYILDTTGTGNINKYSLSGGTWSSAGSYATGLAGFSMCAATNVNGVNLYFVTSAGGVTNNSIIQLTDTASPINSSITVAPASGITLYTAAPGEELKGLAFVPVAIAPTVTTSAATSPATTGATLNGYINNDGGAALTDYGFYWSGSSPVTASSTKLQVGTTDHAGSYTANLSSLAVNTVYYYRAYASNSAAFFTLGGSDVSFYTLANIPTAPIVGTPTTNTLNVSIGGSDGNPAYTEYAIYAANVSEYVQANGTLGATAIYQTSNTWKTVTVTNLLPSTTYNFEVQATNGAGTATSFGPVTSGTTATPATPTISVNPNILNFPPTLANSTSASLSYTIDGTNLSAGIVITAPANFQVSTSSGSGYGSTVNLPLSGNKVPTTTIYVQFQPTAQSSYAESITDTSPLANNPSVAVNGFGAEPPSVTTQVANPTNTTSATLNGNVTATNNAPITDTGFYWSTSPNVNTGTGTKLDESGTSVGAFTGVLSGLTANTLYYFRAYSSNSVGFTLGSADVSFYTLANTPTAPVVNGATTNSLNVAIGGGDGNPTSTEYAIYLTNLSEYVQGNGSLSGSPVYQTSNTWGTVTVTGLSLGTSYGFEAQATNNAGIPTAFGPVANVFTANGPYTPGNVAVQLAASAAANNTTFSILEINPVSDTVVQTVPINGTSGPDAIRVSGSASSSPRIADSDDGTLLVMAGFNSTNSSVTANTITNRAVATLDASNNYVFQTSYVGVTGNQVRNAATVDNKTWYVGDAGGIYTNGDFVTPQNAANIGAIRSFGGVVYVLQSSKSTVPMSSLSADGTTLTPLPGFSARDSAAVDFYMVSSGDNGSAYDILYILDETSATAGVVNKYSLVSGTWTLTGTYATSFGGFGLAAIMSGNNAVNLYVTSGDGTVANNSLYLLTDASGWNSGPNVTASTLLYTAPGAGTLKGVAFAPANPLIVTNAADSGPGTLRQCIANAYSGATIKFASNLSGAKINLASTLTVNTNVTIDGSALANSVQINGQGSVQVFNVESGNNVVMNALTITNASTSSNGGGIYNDGTLTLSDSTLTGNNVSGGGEGGGIDNDSSGTLTVVQCTLSGNNASSSSGGGILNNGTLILNQSTVSGNNSEVGGGIYNSGTMTISNSIVAANNGTDLYNNGGSGTLDGANIVQSVYNPGFGITGNPPFGGNPKLTPLGNYGGPTETMVPTNGSLAIGACTTAIADDQRGFPRANLAATDIGAVGLSYNPSGPGKLGGAKLPEGGTFGMSFTNYSYMSFTVYANTNVDLLSSPWVNVGTATETPVGSGIYLFNDPNSGSYAQRFYRASSP